MSNTQNLFRYSKDPVTGKYYKILADQPGQVCSSLAKKKKEMENESLLAHWLHPFPAEAAGNGLRAGQPLPSDFNKRAKIRWKPIISWRNGKAATTFAGQTVSPAGRTRRWFAGTRSTHAAFSNASPAIGRLHHWKEGGQGKPVSELFVWGFFLLYVL